ncbi:MULTISPECIES: hypothetical protein [unclassified Ensifer]|uniref:hypothetical protein n=1 Tax=unclassified Ensifer TaxID=2633371 RepID=UPI00081347B8|nr:MULTISPECIES: hypothetical protein [unclassified Ensifer]OCP24636.1 hypothetical protein BC363_21795 [Ensifer sp. LC384]OCP25688.1 hypothetical protein BC361_16495 [Ensifer sp. LC54]OCP37922.1 hypothetical protein BC360_19950 [Ensifer sp. LC163]
MDPVCGGNRGRFAGRLFAVLWLFCASLAMQLIVVGQGFSSRLSAEQQAGNFSSPDTAPSDHPAARQISRATPVSDLRFTAERKDGKSVTGDGSTPVLLASGLALPFEPSGQDLAFGHVRFASGLSNRGLQIRAPPRA